MKARNGIELLEAMIATPLLSELPRHGEKRVLAGVSREQYAVEVREFLIKKLAEYGIEYTETALEDGVIGAVGAAFRTYGREALRAA